MAEILAVTNEEQLEQVRTLFRAYHAQLATELCVGNFDREIEGLPGQYAPPRGGLLLATVYGQPAGCVGLRPFPLPGACEMKRLYVRPAFRGESLGRQLIERIVQEARSRQYERLRLDTHPPSMQSAVALYRQLGFVELTEVENAPPGLMYMELKL